VPNTKRATQQQNSPHGSQLKICQTRSEKETLSVHERGADGNRSRREKKLCGPPKKENAEENG
jgi:hypothetical protein